jgi:hypothetical protein
MFNGKLSALRWVLGDEWDVPTANQGASMMDDDSKDSLESAVEQVETARVAA